MLLDLTYRYSTNCRLSWDVLRNQGKHAYQKGQSAEAEFSLQKALGAAEEFGEKDMRLVMSLADLAGYYVLTGQYVLAEPLLGRALIIGEAVLSRADWRALKRKKEALKVVMQTGRLPSLIKWL